MDEDLQNIEDLFRASLLDHVETPSKTVWESVEKRLDDASFVQLQNKYKRLRIISALLLLLLVISIYEIRNNERGKKGSGNFSELPATTKMSAKILENLPSSMRGDSLRGFDSGRMQPNDQIMTPAAQSLPGDARMGQVYAAGNFQDRSPQQKAARIHVHAGEDVFSHQPTHYASNGFKSAASASMHSYIEAADARKNDGNARYKPIERGDDNISYVEKIDFARQDVLPAGYGTLFNVIPIARPVLHLQPSKTAIPGNNLDVLYKNRRGGGLLITVFFSPDFAWYRLQDDEVGSQPDNANRLEKEEKHQFSATYGVLLDKSLSGHWSIQSGVTVANTNITLEPKIIYAQPDNAGNVKYRVNTSSGYGYILPTFSPNPVSGDSLYMYSSVHSLQYIGIPVVISYGILNSRLSISLRQGISVNFLTKAALDVNVENSTDRATETVNNLHGIREIYFSGMTGMNLAYPITKKIAATLTPVFRYALNSIDRNATVKSYPMTFGAVAGLRLRL